MEKTKRIVKKVYHNRTEQYSDGKIYHEYEPAFQLKILGLKKGIFGGWIANTFVKMILPKSDGSVEVVTERAVLTTKDQLEKFVEDKNEEND